MPFLWVNEGEMLPTERSSSVVTSTRVIQGHMDVSLASSLSEIFCSFVVLVLLSTSPASRDPVSR